MKTLGRWLRRIGVALFVLAVLLAIPVLPRITMPRFTAPPGADSMELVVNRGYDINTVGEVLLGRHYRDLWSQPITVTVLDLATFEGGLRPTREGGGQETRSLHFESAGGRHFLFRSVDKEVVRLLNLGLGRSPVGRLVQDQTSSSFPAGALIADPLQKAVGLASGHPRLVVLPDDARLGEYRERYSGIVGLMQEGPEEYVREVSGAETVTEVKNTEAILPLVAGSSHNRLDTHSFLTARLVDVFLNDWDRHEGQWQWAALREDWGTRWLAIPVDRDQAFSSYDGLIMAIARLRTPKLAVFGPAIPPIRGLTHNSRSLDRRLLAGLDRRVWDSTAAFVVARLSDSVIDDAVKRLPQPYYRLSGAMLVETLKKRRDQLPAFAVEFYLTVAKRSDVHATGEADSVSLVYHQDGGVEVRIAPSGADTKQAAWFSRTYLPAETEQINLRLGGGKDRIVVTGIPSSAIAMRVFDEQGRELSMESVVDTTKRR